MKTRRLVIAACVGLLLATVPVVAHHSFSAEFDANAPVEVTGAVQKIEWLNPHVWFFMDVEDDEGDVTSWAMEMGSPNQLVRARPRAKDCQGNLPYRVPGFNPD